MNSVPAIEQWLVVCNVRNSPGVTGWAVAKHLNLSVSSAQKYIQKAIDNRWIYSPDPHGQVLDSYYFVTTLGIEWYTQHHPDRATTLTAGWIGFLAGCATGVLAGYLSAYFFR